MHILGSLYRSTVSQHVKLTPEFKPLVTISPLYLSALHDILCVVFDQTISQMVYPTDSVVQDLTRVLGYRSNRSFTSNFNFERGVALRKKFNHIA